jgi:excisionase family DNA binding protein
MEPVMVQSPSNTGRPAFLDVEGVARYLSVSVRHIRRLVADRRIPHHKVGHLLRFDPAEIDVWLDLAHRGPDVSGRASPR